MEHDLYLRIISRLMKTFSNSKGKIRSVKVIQLLPNLPTLSVHGAEENASESQSGSAVSNPLRPHGLYSLWNSPDQNTGVGSYSLLQGIIPTQGSNPGLPQLQAVSLPAEPQGKPRNTGVGSLSLHQGIFLTQELNWGLLYFR